MPVSVLLLNDPLPRTSLHFATHGIDLINRACPKVAAANISVFAGTFESITASDSIVPSSDGFFRGAVEAWAKHMHLVIRPEDVWFAILIQLSYYMVAHAEDVRHLFVSHSGTKELLIQGKTFDEIMRMVGGFIQTEVKTDWLLEWIAPDFTTTTPSDILTANALLMGLVEKYFDYSFEIICGIPSVTLLGEQSDWEKLLARLDGLAAFGEEPTEFASGLQPILENFVNTFKDPDGKDTQTFWQGIVHAEHSYLCGSPPIQLTGWIMNFYRWDSSGARSYATIDELPVSYVKVPVYYINTKQNLLLVAGNLGKRITTGAPRSYFEKTKKAGRHYEEDESKHATLQPMSGWMLFGDKDEKKDMIMPMNNKYNGIAGDEENSGLYKAVESCMGGRIEDTFEYPWYQEQIQPGLGN